MSALPTTAPLTPAERVMTELEAWRPLFERGELSPLIDAPDLPALQAERFAVDIGPVRAAGLGRASAGGLLRVSNLRAMVIDGPEPVREWNLEDLDSLSALGNWGGLVVVHAGGNTELVVAAGPELPGWEDAVAWLKAEAAFAAGQGRLPAWIAELPRRLAQPSHS